jgi:hypothetical protein
MKKSELKSLIKEIIIDKNCIAFFISDNKAYIAFANDSLKRGYSHEEIESFYKKINRPCNHISTFSSRGAIGRIFCQSKDTIITFYSYPKNQQQLMEIILLIKEELKNTTELIIPLSKKLNADINLIEVPKLMIWKNFPEPNAEDESFYEFINVNEYGNWLEKNNLK